MCDPAFRPYLNSLHDHFRNIEAANAAIANLPGYDIPAFDPAARG